MGFLDKIKSKVKDAVQGEVPPPAQAAAHEDEVHQQEEDQDHDQDLSGDGGDEEFDLAGFDPLGDEEGFYNAVLHMESEGQFGGTDESRAEIMQRYGIRDRMHWLTVKESCYSVLARQYGGNEVGQREMNWRMGQMQQHQMQQQQKMAASGGFEPVEGVSLEAWAAMNASIASGANAEDLLKGARIDQARWDRVSAEWNARMARDTTFAVATVYGNAFQAASTGKYGEFAREAAAARAGNRDLEMAPPMEYERYYEILQEQAYAAKQGKDPVAALKDCGLSIVDWTDLGSYFGYYFHRDGVRNWNHYEAIHKRVEAKYEAKYPGVKVDLDIQF